MAFAVIPFCWRVKFSGITRFLYQFWKFSSKYCIDKEKDHYFLWSKWYSRREYFGLRPRADCVGANRRALRGRSSPIEIPKARPCLCKGRAFGTPGGNRTHNGPLGGGCYIHLTTEAYFIRLCQFARRYPSDHALVPIPSEISGVTPRHNAPTAHDNTCILHHSREKSKRFLMRSKNFPAGKSPREFFRTPGTTTILYRPSY